MIGRIEGFRVGLEISGGSGHTVLATHFSENFRQRLASTPDAEDPGDWLWPHENDENGRQITAIYMADLEIATS